ncbi:hypothetical protein HDU93_002041 [Gonapodya sp. JEL0774]|nr:hypothetical protein HDU93_002041 [Gonapodya sp. JEL0774]
MSSTLRPGFSPIYGIGNFFYLLPSFSGSLLWQLTKASIIPVAAASAVIVVGYPLQKNIIDAIFSVSDALKSEDTSPLSDSDSAVVIESKEVTVITDSGTVSSAKSTTVNYIDSSILQPALGYIRSPEIAARTAAAATVLEAALVARLISSVLFERVRIPLVREVLALRGADTIALAAGAAASTLFKADFTVLASPATISTTQTFLLALLEGPSWIPSATRFVVSIASLPLSWFPILGPLLYSYANAVPTAVYDLDPYFAVVGRVAPSARVEWLAERYGDIQALGYVATWVLGWAPVVGDLGGAVGAALWAGQVDGLIA